MPINKAPYIRYSEETSVVDYGSTGAEIPVFIAPSKVVKNGNYTAVTTVDTVYTVSSFKQAQSLFDDPARTSSTSPSELVTVLSNFFEENSYYYGDELGASYVYVIPLPLSPTVANLSSALDLITKKKDVQVISVLGINDLSGVATELAVELKNQADDGFFRIAYLKAPANAQTTYQNAVKNVYASGYDDDTDGQTALNTFVTTNATTYAKAIALINKKINNARICLVEPDFYGYHIAKICNTPYYLEAGYLPYYSVDVGEFEELTVSERDARLMSGLIFGEDDYTLEEIVPRMCLGVSSAFGRTPDSTDEEYKTRIVDSLLHARRNVDHQIREIYKIIAPQLKRNETSVTIRYVQDEVMSYLDGELDAGNIMQYEFSVQESSYNPYCLLVTGKIVPVNSTLAIEFKNTIGSPYAVASDYI